MEKDVSPHKYKKNRANRTTFCRERLKFSTKTPEDIITKEVYNAIHKMFPVNNLSQGPIQRYSFPIALNDTLADRFL